MVFRKQDEKASISDFELPLVFVDSVGSHLIECVIEVAVPELYDNTSLTVAFEVG